MAKIDPEFAKKIKGITLEKIYSSVKDIPPTPFPPVDDEFCESRRRRRGYRPISGF
ncbi:MAG: hypothetical protein ACI309_07020 [Candidatus Limisoma sp.]